MRKAFSLVIFWGFLSAQSQWLGTVITEDGGPVAYAVVQHSSTGKWTISDENGYFIFTGAFDTGDTITVSRYGYRIKKFVLPSKTSFIIQLSMNPINLPQITELGSRIKPNSRQEFFTVIKPASLGETEYNQLLQGIPGLSLRSYGGPASIKTISLDGGPASHTKILIQGFDITNIQNGETDISQLPLPFIEQARFIPVATGLQTRASDGLILLDPWSTSHRVQFSSGSYGHNASSIATSITGSKWASRFLIGKRNDSGNYPVTWRGNTFNRQNNHFEQHFAATQSSLILSEQLFIKILAFYSKQERGVAGLIYSPSNAWRNDHILFWGATSGWITTKSRSHFRLSGRSSNDHYHDETYNINSTHSLESYTLNFDRSTELSRSLTIDFSLKYSIDHLSSRDAGFQKRATLINLVGLAWKPLKSISIKPDWQHYSVSRQVDESVSQITAEWSPESLTNFTATVNTGNSIRYPTFNELYWLPGGNIDLKAEHTTNHSLICELAMSNWGHLNAQLFTKQSKDLIQWVPQGSYWSPKNIKSVSRTGWRLSWRWVFERIPIDGFLSLGRVRAKYLEPGDHYEKQMVYTPRQTGAAAITWSPKQWTLHWQVHYASELISRYSWPKDILLPGVTLHQISAGYRFQVFSGKLHLVIGLENLTDKIYESVQGYPEPGRTWRLTATYEQ